MEEFIQPWVDADEAGPPSQEEQKAGNANHVKQLDEDRRQSFTTNDSLFPRDAPRALFVVRFREDVRGEDLSVEPFRERLRSIPAAADEVRVEAGFKCFSTLILITVPIVMFSYIAHNHAIFFIRPVKSPMLPTEVQPVSFCSNEESIEDTFSEPFFDTSKIYSFVSHKPLIVKPELFPESKFNI
jgi:hypothetical protein